MSPVAHSLAPLQDDSPSSDPALRQVPAVTRAAAVLRLLGRSPEPLGVNAIARALDIIPSTCLHILRALVAEELVAFDPATKRYSLDAGILSLARNLLRQERLGRSVQPVLDQIAERHGVTALGVRSIGLAHMIVVAVSRSPSSIHLHTDVGGRFPALISATGRCLAAFGGHGAEAIRNRFHELRWDNPPSLAAWLDEVEETARQGYAVDAGRYIRGVTIVAAPVLDEQRRMTHSIVALAVHEQIAHGLKSLIADVRKAADAASENAPDD
jgi:DNA-binding IclR family transcriptional regulator